MAILESPYLYLALNLFTISIPLWRSFESKYVNFKAHFKGLFLGIFITAIFFIVWDIWFTYIGVWGFNQNYLIGVSFFNLPIEEFLFFITVPYACVFVYEVLNTFVKRNYVKSFEKPFTLILALLLIILAIFNYQKLYTFFNFIFCGSYLLLHLFVFKTKYLSRFYLAFFVCLLGFFLVNGTLTGSFTQQPVVWYNNSHNLGIRIATIPIEDTFYGLLLVLMVITIFERYKKK